MTPNQHQKLVATRLKDAMAQKKWRLEDLSRATGIAVSTLGNYRTGLRLMKPWDAKGIAGALGVRAAFLLCLEDSQFSPTAEEERLVRNWRALPENERQRLALKLEAEAMAYRSDAIPDARLGHLSAAEKGSPRAPAQKQSRHA